MNITNQITRGSSGYIHDYVYYIKERKLVITLLNHPVEQIPCTNVIFTDVRNFEETCRDLDDDCLDDFWGVDKNDDVVLITTIQRDLSFKTKNEPIIEMIEEG